MFESWLGLPYHPISVFYKRRFAERVRKISIGTADTCPNREGLAGMQTCNFCDEWGSAAHPDKAKLNLPEQIRQVRDLMRRLYRAEKFLVYFQAYTTTYGRVGDLERQFEVALSFQDVVGLVVGTRPDCISDALLEMWSAYMDRTFLSVELGVQSFSEEQLLWMRRGHTAERARKAIRRIRKALPQLDLGIHLMFGLPNETDEQIVATAQECNDLKINHVKLHNLHVLKNTPLAEDFLRGEFKPIEMAEYFHRCELFLKHLSPQIAVHRLAALSNKPGELLAPAWTGNKMKTYQDFLSHMRNQKAYQGQLWVPQEERASHDNSAGEVEDLGKREKVDEVEEAENVRAMSVDGDLNDGIGDHSAGRMSEQTHLDS